MLVSLSQLDAISSQKVEHYLPQLALSIATPVCSTVCVVDNQEPRPSFIYWGEIRDSSAIMFVEKGGDAHRGSQGGWSHPASCHLQYEQLSELRRRAG